MRNRHRYGRTDTPSYRKIRIFRHAEPRPPLLAVYIALFYDNEVPNFPSLSDFCHSKSLICDSAFLPLINSQHYLRDFGISCHTLKIDDAFHLPAFNATAFGKNLLFHYLQGFKIGVSAKEL